MERYADIQKIGEGSFGSVHRATDSETGQVVAIKVFHSSSSEVSRSAVREARFLSACSHCNITALVEAYQSSSGRVYLVLEYAQHVLSHQLKAHAGGLPTVAARSIIFQLLQALNYLHSRNIMHRDCKPANVLITSDGMVKLCDFGFARYVEATSPGTDMSQDDGPLTPYVITRWYRAPEVLAGQPYTTAVDIWGVGCIFAEMLTGHPLFPGTSSLDQLYMEHIGLGGLSPEQQAVMRSNAGYTKAKSECLARLGQPATRETVFDRLAPCMSKSMMEFFKACMVPDPAKRATAQQLLDMPFIKEGAWEAPAPVAPPAMPADQLPAQDTSLEVSSEHNTVQGGGEQVAAPAEAQEPQPPTRVQPTSGKKAGRQMKPTVKQRTARQAMEMMGSSDEEEEAVRRLAHTLPIGEPLSDSDSAGSADSSPTKAAAAHAITDAHAADDAQVQGSQPSIKAGRLHTSFVKGHRESAPSQPLLGFSISKQPLLNSVSVDVPTHEDQHTRQADTVRRRKSASRQADSKEPNYVSIQSHDSVLHASAFASTRLHGQQEPTSSTSKPKAALASSRLSRKTDEVSFAVAGEPSSGAPTTLRYGKHSMEAHLQQTQNRWDNDSNRSTDEHEVVTRRSDETDTSSSQEDNTQKPLSAVYQALCRPIVPLSTSGVLLPSRTSMYQAKPLQGIRPGSGRASTGAGQQPADTSVQIKKAHKSRSTKQPTQQVVAAAAITQACTNLTPPDSDAWMGDTGSKSVGGSYMLHPVCPPPPTNQFKTQDGNEDAQADDGQQGSDSSRHRSDGGQVKRWPHRQLVSSHQNGLHISGRLSRVAPDCQGGLMQVDESPNFSSLSKLSDRRRSSAVNFSNEASSEVAGQALPVQPDASLTVTLIGSGSKSQGRMLSPMAMRVSSSRKLSTTGSVSGTAAEQQPSANI